MCLNIDNNRNIISIFHDNNAGQSIMSVENMENCVVIKNFIER